MPEDKVTAGATALKSDAIRLAVLRRNPFFNCARIEIRNKDFGCSPGERNATRRAFQAASCVAVDCLAAITQTIGAAVGLIVGLAVAVLLVVIPLEVAGYLLSTEASSRTGTFLLNQSWGHYVGWMLCCVTAYLFPYLVLGIPIGLSLRFFWPIHRLFTAKKARREIRSGRDNNDPAARVPDDVTNYRLNLTDSPFCRPIKVIWWVISRITISCAGLWALACFAILYLKLGTMLLKQDAVLMIVIGGMMLYALRFPYAFLHSRMGTGAIDHLISSLFQGESYREALGQALGSMGVV
jgi:hypothetical protein